MAKILLISAVLLAAAALGITLQQAAQAPQQSAYGYLAYVLAPGPYAPGQVIHLPIVLMNPAAELVKANVTIVGGPLLMFSNFSLSCTTYVPSHSNSTCVIPAEISPDIRPGSYRAALNITYTYLPSNRSIAFEKNFSLPVAGFVDFNLALMPRGIVVPGQPALFELFISTGGTAQPTNVTITPLNTSTLEFLPATIRIPLLTSVQIPLQAFVKSYGALTATFKICYFNDVCLVKNTTFYLPAPTLAINIAQNPPWAYPGSIVQLTISLSADQAVGPMDVKVSSPGLEILEGRSFHLPMLPSSSPLTLTSIIKVPDGAKPGEYPVVVSIDGRNYTAYIHVESPTIIIQNIVLKPPVIIAGSPAPYVEATVFLANTGVVPARNVVLSLSGLPTLGNSSVDIGVLPPGQPAQVPFLINASALSAGTYNVAARATWLGGEVRAASPLTVLPKADLEVSYRVSNAQPGSTAVLVLTIINKGPVAAKMVTLQWTPNQVFQLHTPSSSTPTATLLESGLRVLGDMAPGQNLSTTYLLDVSDKIPPGVYFATIVIEWNETGSPIPAVETVQIPISVSSSINWLEVGPLAAAAAVMAAGIALFISRRGRGAAAGGR